MDEAEPGLAKELARLQEQIRALEKLNHEKFTSRDKATDTALVAMDKRLEGMNEFRNALTDQAARMITRVEYQNAHGIIVDRMTKAESTLANWDGRIWAFTVAAVIVSTTISWALKLLR